MRYLSLSSNSSRRDQTSSRRTSQPDPPPYTSYPTQSHLGNKRSRVGSFLRRWTTRSAPSQVASSPGVDRRYHTHAPTRLDPPAYSERAGPAELVLEGRHWNHWVSGWVGSNGDTSVGPGSSVGQSHQRLSHSRALPDAQVNRFPLPPHWLGPRSQTTSSRVCAGICRECGLDHADSGLGFTDLFFALLCSSAFGRANLSHVYQAICIYEVDGRRWDELAQGIRRGMWCVIIWVCGS